MDAEELNTAQAEHGSHLLMHLQRMRSTQELTDVVLLTEGVPVYCHKVVLSAFSPYFQVKEYQYSHLQFTWESGMSQGSVTYAFRSCLHVVWGKPKEPRSSSSMCLLKVCSCCWTTCIKLTSPSTMTKSRQWLLLPFCSMWVELLGQKSTLNCVF